jgi:Flp pilus assembly protein TadG
MKKMTQPDLQEKRTWRIGWPQLRSALKDTLGSGVLELGLIMPTFALLLVVAAEGGRMAYFAIEVSNAARAGVAYGSQSTATSTQTTAIQTAASNDAPNLTRIGTLTVTSSIACQCASGTSFTTITCGSVSTACISPSHAIKFVQVNTSAPVSSMFRYPGLPTIYTLQGQAIMRIQ